MIPGIHADQGLEDLDRLRVVPRLRVQIAQEEIGFGLAGIQTDDFPVMLLSPSDIPQSLVRRGQQEMGIDIIGGLGQGLFPFLDGAAEVPLLQEGGGQTTAERKRGRIKA